MDCKKFREFVSDKGTGSNDENVSEKERKHLWGKKGENAGFKHFLLFSQNPSFLWWHISATRYEIS